MWASDEERREAAIATHKELQKRKWRKQRLERDAEIKKQNDTAETGWNGYMKHMNERLKKYY